ncbi:hypothetical protein [Kocuria marina]|uniref:hypothetical protein n=1 Tax=Kocuria marina TaxID=223184 RepID=UPI0021A452D5|nr:hypothetical protein [Kocuria marina]MCT1617417.1 hypothetical protein [Kocuria marina]
MLVRVGHPDEIIAKRTQMPNPVRQLRLLGTQHRVNEIGGIVQDASNGMQFGGFNRSTHH